MSSPPASQSFDPFLGLFTIFPPYFQLFRRATPPSVAKAIGRHGGRGLVGMVPIGGEVGRDEEEKEEPPNNVLDALENR